MTREVLGLAMLLLPFGVLFGIFARLMGWRSTVVIFALTAVLVAWIGAAVWIGGWDQ